jgi:hypothetical protein
MKKLLIFSVIVLFIGLSFNQSYLESNAQTKPLVFPTPCDDETVPCPQPTPEILSVVFEQVNSPLDCNPKFGSSSQCDGSRIFPDKDNPNDQTNRRIVKVKAVLSTASPNAKVYFKTFDVDDPATDMIIDSNGVTGDDNRVATNKAGTLSNNISDPGTTNVADVGSGNGVAVVYLTVTSQPGDNFVVAAVVNDSNYLENVSVDGTGLKHSVDGVLPTIKAKRTEMLTVWRRLHIEVDSMGNVGTDNNVTGEISTIDPVICPAGIPGCTAGATISRLTVNTTPALEDKRFSNGRIKIGRDFYKVLSNNPTLVLLNTEMTAREGANFTLYDDDDYNDNDGVNKDGDNNEVISRLPDSFKYLSDSDGNYPDGRPKNLYASAYIMPEYAALASYNQTNLPITLNVLEANVATTINSNRNSSSVESDNFWVGYFLVGYQEATNEDGDGETAVVAGTNPPSILCDCYQSTSCIGTSCTVIPKGGSGALIFQEAMQDATKTFFSAGQVIRVIGTTAPHELGHQFGLKGDNRDPVTGNPTRPIATYMLMDYPHRPDETDIYELHPEHINLIRSRVKSPGE